MVNRMYKYGSTKPELLLRLRKLALLTTAAGAFGMGLASLFVDLWHGARSIGNSIANGWDSLWSSSPQLKQMAAWRKAMRDHSLAKDRKAWSDKTDVYWDEHPGWYGFGKGTAIVAPMLLPGGGIASLGAKAGLKGVSAMGTAGKALTYANRAYNMSLAGIPAANVFTDNPDPFNSNGHYMDANGAPDGYRYSQMTPLSYY